MNILMSKKEVKKSEVKVLRYKEGEKEKRKIDIHRSKLSPVFARTFPQVCYRSCWPL